MLTKVDLRKELKHLYTPSPKTVQVVDVPEMNFLMVDGAGDPNTAQEYKDSIEALYNVSYTLKFRVKKEQEVDYTVMSLEGLWWTDDMAQFRFRNKGAWKWTSMMMQPKYVTVDLVKRAIEQVRKRKDLAALSKMRFESFHEGLSAQIMHIGPYSDEGPTIEKLHDYIKEEGFKLRGKHHEIYLGDPRRAAPAKLKTIVRQPMARS